MKKKPTKKKANNPFRLGEHLQKMPIKEFVQYIKETYSLAPPTVEQRKSHWRSWEAYCDEEGLSTHDVSVVSIEGYVAWKHKQGHTGIGTYLSGIGAHFMDNGLAESEWKSIISGRDVHLVNRGVSRWQSILGREIKHAPAMTITQLKSICDYTADHQDDYNQVLFCAIMVVSFFGVHRMEELVAPDRETIMEEGKHIDAKSVILLTGGIKYVVLSQKTSYRKPENCFIMSWEWPDWANAAYLRYHFARAQSPVRFHRTLFVTKEGTIPNKTWVEERLHSIDPALTGHSPRVGGASWMAANGANALTIQMKGRWESEAFRQYIRQHPELQHELYIRNNLPPNFKKN